MVSPSIATRPFHVPLDDAEWRFIRLLREIPPSPLRDRMCLVIEDLLHFVANPGCPEIQADGVPCADVHMACDRCRKLLGLLDSLRRQVPTS
jgi:hypothetical protein